MIRVVAALTALVGCVPHPGRPADAWVTVEDAACAPPATAPRVRLACPPGSRLATSTFDGDVEIVTSLDLSSLTRVTGRLTVPRGANVGELRADHLTTVGGLELRSHLLGAASFASLTEVTGDLRWTQTAATPMVLPRLTRVSGTLEISEASALTDVDLPALTEVGVHVVIRDAPALTRVSLPALTAVRGAVDLGAQLGQAPVTLTSLDLTSLTTVGGGLAIRGTRLEAITLTSLREVTGDLMIAGNLWARELQMPALTFVHGDAAIDNQPLDPDALTRLERDLRPLVTGALLIR